MSDSIQTQNWQRITDELDAVIDDLPGPYEGASWDAFGGETMRETFRETVKNVLTAELQNRSANAQSIHVNKAIGQALSDLGEAMAQASATQERDDDV